MKEPFIPYQIWRVKGRLIDFVRRNVHGTFRGGGGGEVGLRVLLLDVSVKLKIIDFLQPRIKQKLR